MCWVAHPGLALTRKTKKTPIELQLDRGSRFSKPAVPRQVELNRSHQLLDSNFPGSDALDFDHDLSGGLDRKGGFAAVVSNLID
jgi:hypothetical protein